jgi:hypothetical protein
MSLFDRLNRLDERTGADRLGQGMRLYGLYFVWPLAVVFGLVYGTASLMRGWLIQGFVMYGFAACSGWFIFFGIRASRAYRAQRRAAGELALSDAEHKRDVR